MKRVQYYILPAALLALASGCMVEPQNEDAINLPETRRYEVSFDMPTKTALGNNNRSVHWENNDRIYYYTEPNQLCDVNVSMDNNVAYISIPLPYDAIYLNAFYSGAANSADSSNPILTYPTPQEQTFTVEGVAAEEQCIHSFSEAHACAACLSDIFSTTMQFHNVVSIFKFNLDDASIKKVVFSSSDREVISGGPDGLIQIDMDHDGSIRSVSPYRHGTSSITINTDGEGDYYFSIIPSYLQEGFRLECYDGVTATELVKTVEYRKPLAAGVSESGVLNPTVINLGKTSAWKTAEEGVHVQSIVLDKQSISIMRFESAQLTAAVTPSYATNTAVIWSSSDNAVATVDGTGLVSGVGEGVCTITAHAVDNPAICASCNVTVEDQGGGIDTGLYLGITGFNQELYNYPFTRLNEVSISGFYSFVDGLQMKAGTLLCYGVDQSINRLKEASFPDDLCAVALVTFTDGLDQGSLMMSSSYNSDDDYLNAINRRIQNERISGHTIKAYSVGLRGSDVSDEEKFRSNLLKLSSGSDYAFEVSSMYEVNTKLQEIAKNVTDIIYVYDLALTVPGTEARVRFTFDDVSDAGNSELYIEGTVSRDLSLKNVIYHGLSSVSGSTIYGTANGIFITFPFKTVKRNSGGTISQSSIRQWNYVSKTGRWQINSEFDASQHADVEVTKQSVAVMLVLDCSSSLGYQYYTMQSHAKSFIQSLQEASYNPYAVSSVSLNYTSKSVYVGEEFYLTATVTPSTAKDKTVYWTSSNSSIAYVDQSGKVTTKSVGKAVITARTVDGGYTASCEVEVKPILVSSIKFDKTSLTLNEGETALISATISPDNATNKSLTWTSSDNSVATVDALGRIKAIKIGSATIKATANDGSNVSAACMVTVKTRTYINGREYVDLGLPSGLKWASCNVGATSPEGYGEYFAWGETQPKENYSWSTYKFELGTNYNGPFSKYVTNSSYGNVDNNTILDPEDDAASANWGGSWRMPTDEEWTELRNNCTWTWTDNYNYTGIAGRLVLAQNGNSIFLPAAGYRYGTNLHDVGSNAYYWSSSLYAFDPYNALNVYFHSGNVYRSSNGRYRCYGQSIRPVSDDRIHPVSVTLNMSELSLFVGDSETLIATIFPDNATDKSLTWSSSDESVASVYANGKVMAVSYGSTKITVKANDGSNVSATCMVTVKLDLSKPDSVEAVDLGLLSGIKWATCNVGASKPEEYGEYFAWGETEPKSDYRWSTYKWCNGTRQTLTKYCTNSDYWGSSSPMDNKTVLDPEDDAASANWGGSWRMPTYAEWRELRENCTWEWTDNYNGTGIKGRIVTSKKSGYTDKAIFLPAAGSRCDTRLCDVGTGNYRSSSLYTDTPYYERFVQFYSGYVYLYDIGGSYRCDGLSVRPVTEK